VKLNILLFSLSLCTVPAAYAIPDQEPEVTTQVAEVLEGVAERGASYLAAPGLAAAMKGCTRPLALELLSRNVNGEDRLYVYRAKCQPQALRIAVDFNKAARINRLELAPER
jgi:hypothetical protein